MCLQDLKLGRKRISRTTSAAMVIGDILAIRPNASRVALLISAASSGTLIMRIYRDNTVDNTHLVAVLQSSNNLLLRIEDCGDLITAGFSMQSLAVGALVGSFTEFFLNETDAQLGRL